MSKLFLDIMQGFREFAEMTGNIELMTNIDTKVESVSDDCDGSCVDKCVDNGEAM